MPGTNTNTNTFPTGSTSLIPLANSGLGTFKSNELTFTQSLPYALTNASALVGHGGVEAADIRRILTEFGSNTDAVDIIASVSNYPVERDGVVKGKTAPYGAPLLLEGKTIQIITTCDAAVVMQPGGPSTTVVQNIQLDWGDDEQDKQSLWFATLDAESNPRITLLDSNHTNTIILNQNVNTQKGTFNNGSLIMNNSAETFTTTDMRHIEIIGIADPENPELVVPNAVAGNAKGITVGAGIELHTVDDAVFQPANSWSIDAPTITLNSDSVNIHGRDVTWNARAVYMGDTTFTPLKRDTLTLGKGLTVVGTNFTAYDLDITTCHVAVNARASTTLTGDGLIFNIAGNSTAFTAGPVGPAGCPTVEFSTINTFINSVAIDMTASSVKFETDDSFKLDATTSLSLKADEKITLTSSSSEPGGCSDVKFQGRNSTSKIKIIFPLDHDLTLVGETTLYTGCDVAQISDSITANKSLTLKVGESVNIKTNNTTVNATAAIKIYGENAQLHDTELTNMTAPDVQFKVGGDNFNLKIVDTAATVELGSILNLSHGNDVAVGRITINNAIHMSHELTYNLDVSPADKTFNPNEFFSWERDDDDDSGWQVLVPTDFVSNTALNAENGTFCFDDKFPLRIKQSPKVDAVRAEGGPWCTNYIKDLLKKNGVLKWRDIRGTVWVASNKVRRFEVSELKHGGALSAQRICGLSDRRFKKNITQMTTVYLNKVKELTPVSWNWKVHESQKIMGFIAQDAVKILPSIVSGGSNNKYYSIDYTQLISTLPLVCAKLDELESLIPQ